VPENLLVIMRP